jgi:UDP-N-acetyl-D-mannosaminuronic acid dehydrogenase
MNKLEEIISGTESTLKDILYRLDIGGKLGLPAGIVLVTDKEGKLKGTVTDGDVRRALIRGSNMDTPVSQFMNHDPIFFRDYFTIGQILDELPKELSKKNRPSKNYLSKIVLVDENLRPTRLLDYHQLWEQKVATHRHIVIVGLGYVGLTLALVLADIGFQVTGIDVDEARLMQLKRGISYVHEVGINELLREQISKNFNVQKDIPEDGDVYIISVGTPVMHNPVSGKSEPILTYLQSAVGTIATKLRRGDLVILRSTVPVGTCRKFVKEEFERLTGLICGIDFHLSFAPERTAEGRALKELRELPQIIGGYDSDSTEATVALFKELTKTIVRVDSLESAEMAKLINNSFRDYVFAFTNHLAQLASVYNININEVVHAANEGYPRDKVPLPSPGVGGPCLTKDPHIFASVAEKVNLSGDIFKMSRRVNTSMHHYVKENVLTLLSECGKDPKKAKLLVCGLAFKGNPETGDLRNSTAIEIFELLRPEVGEIYGHDAVATFDQIREFNIEPRDLPEGFAGMDAVIFLNNHKSFEKVDVFNMVRSLNENPLIYDGWGLFRYKEFLNTRPCIFAGLSFYKSSI